MGMHISNELTFAGLESFLPRVINPRVALISTVLVPGTTRIAATEFAGSSLGAALGTIMYFRGISNGCTRRSAQSGSGFRGDFCSRLGFCYGDIWDIGGRK